MDAVIEQMGKPAPKHVVEGVCQRLKEIESIEKATGPLLADECRKFIYARDEITWMDVLISAYYMNGGVMLREAFDDEEDQKTCENAGYHANADNNVMEGPHGPSNSPKHAPVDSVPVLESDISVSTSPDDLINFHGVGMGLGLEVEMQMKSGSGSGIQKRMNTVPAAQGNDGDDSMESIEALIASMEMEDMRLVREDSSCTKKGSALHTKGTPSMQKPCQKESSK